MLDGDTPCGGENHLAGTTVLYASLAGVAIGGPLLGAMGFILLVSAALLLISSPLLLLFSPLLLFGSLILATSVSGFGTGATMAAAGFLVLAWAFRSIREKSLAGVEWASLGQWVGLGRTLALEDPVQPSENGVETEVK